MARYLQFRLPPLKVTQRSAGGSCLKKDVQRGASLGDIHPCSQQDVTETESVDYNLALGFEGDYEPPEGPNLYEIQQQANAAAWERIRRMMLNAVVESNAMPLGQACVKCLQHRHHFDVESADQQFSTAMIVSLLTTSSSAICHYSYTNPTLPEDYDAFQEYTWTPLEHMAQIAICMSKSIT